jgi:murein L,D-transpeptidase YcbB/YkuD
MSIFSHNKRILFLFLTVLLLVQSACKKDRTFDQILYKVSKNNIYKEIDEAKFATVLEATIAEETKKLKHPTFILDFYKNNGFQAVLLKRYLPNHQLEDLSDYLSEADVHGLSPAIFNAEDYQKQIDKVMVKETIKSLDDAYEALAQLEIQTADKLLSYSNALSYGLLDPTKIFNRYYMETKRPDSSSMIKVLNEKDLKNYLDSIQPSSESYKILQKALTSSTTAPKKSEEETKKIIQANLERLRWKHSYDSLNMVYVNIPAFKLVVIQDGKPTEEMKVVVGTGRNNADKDEIGNHSKPLVDVPHSHETPVLSSLIHSVQVNPIWNIPESIASKEILNLIKNDRFYLANNGIEVLENEKVIEDPESIDWSAVSKENLPYRFRQKPGVDNALGKIKFLFKNNSSVYLHDTPAQAAFERDIRASSHGCVRVEKPLDLADFIFKDAEKFKFIKNEMEGTSTNAKDISLEPKMTVVLDYMTIVANREGIEFFPDIYGLDMVLYSHL